MKDKFKKADVLLDDLTTVSGVLDERQATGFIDKLLKTPVLLSSIRREVIRERTATLPKIGFTSRVLRPTPGEGVELAPADRAGFASESITLSTKQFLATILITDDMLRFNIEQDALETHLVNLLAERASLDMEEIVMVGSTGYSTGDTDYLGRTLTADDVSFLSQIDGLYKLADESTVDLSGGTPPTIDLDVFKKTIFGMPSQYIRNRNAMRFYVSHDNETEYHSTLADRATPLGDNKIENAPGLLRSFGVPIQALPFASDTRVIFTDPMNLILVVNDEITIETERKAGARATLVHLSLRMGFGIEEPEAVCHTYGFTAPTS